MPTGRGAPDGRPLRRLCAKSNIAGPFSDRSSAGARSQRWFSLSVGIDEKATSERIGADRYTDTNELTEPDVRDLRPVVEAAIKAFITAAPQMRLDYQGNSVFLSILLSILRRPALLTARYRPTRR